MNSNGHWLQELGAGKQPALSGLVYVREFFDTPSALKSANPEQVLVLEKARDLKATAVLFEATFDDRPPLAQALIFVVESNAVSDDFKVTHQRLWSWGGVPLAYRVQRGLAELFRCAHRPEFVEGGKLQLKPYDSLSDFLTVEKAYWDAERLRNGTLWDDPEVCDELLSRDLSAAHLLKDTIETLYRQVTRKKLLPEATCRKLLILSLLIAYLEDRKVLEPIFFEKFLDGAAEFFEVLADGPALIRMLEALEERFNGGVFALDEHDRQIISTSDQLAQFASFVQTKGAPGGQMSFWKQFSFADLPVELISSIYQLFAKDTKVAVYTPPVLVRLIVAEALSFEKIDQLLKQGEIILDPSCGSGVFLVEAYKRLILHWRLRNEWKRPNETDLRELLSTVHGIDIEESAIEVASFSLCLAMCDALIPEEIRAAIKLFPIMSNVTLHRSCFFEAISSKLLPHKIGAIIGNPPFKSQLTTPAGKRAAQRFRQKHGRLPDQQAAYLFLYQSLGAVSLGGIVALIQPYGFLYNALTSSLRKSFFSTYRVREVLDLVSIRALFTANTKVVVVIAENQAPSLDSHFLHATFRRTARANAEQFFDIDYYDLHLVPAWLPCQNDSIWRANLLGGSRVLDFINRIQKYRSLNNFVSSQKGWKSGEGYTKGSKGTPGNARHLFGRPHLGEDGLGAEGVDTRRLTSFDEDTLERPRDKMLYQGPVLLIRKHMDMHSALWEDPAIVYGHHIFGVKAPTSDVTLLNNVYKWLVENHEALKAYLVATSNPVLIARATAINSLDIKSLPFPENGNLELSDNERILIKDILSFYLEAVSGGENYPGFTSLGEDALAEFSSIFVNQVNGFLGGQALRALEAHSWQGAICQPFLFGEGQVDWADSTSLHKKIEGVLQQRENPGLVVTRILKLYDGNAIYLVKPNRLRYWLGSVALRDADDTLSDFWRKGI